MTSRDLFELAGRNLRQSRLRNSLTALGIAVGVASLVSMLSLGVGLQRLATSGIQRSGLLDTLTVTPANSGPGFAPNVAAQNSRQLDEAVRRELERLKEVREVYPNLTFAVESEHGGTNLRGTASAQPMSARESETFSRLQGSFFSSSEAAEAVLSEQFAKQLSNSPGTAANSSGTAANAHGARELANEWRGKEIAFSYGERTRDGASGFQVSRRAVSVKAVGVLEGEAPGGGRGPGGGGPPGPGGGRGAGGAVSLYLPLGYAEKLSAVQPSDFTILSPAQDSGPRYASLTVRLKSPGQAASAETAIKKMGFNTFSIVDATSALRTVFTVVDLFLGAFGSLALAVASIGIVNTLIMSILERRREIGIMKAVGASDSDVRKIFLAEAGVLGLAGGALGITIGWGIGKIINFGVNLYMQNQGVREVQIWFVPWWLIIGALAFSLLASLLSGVYPASRAARLEPLDALRYE